MPDYAFGIDVSHHQSPRSVDYRGLKEHECSFVYVRAQYGVTRDEAAAEHIQRADDAGLRVGLYAFFRPSIGWKEQLDAFIQAHAELGMGVRDLVPALDVEDDRNRSGIVTSKIDKSWAVPVEHILEGLKLHLGSAILYGYESGLPLLGGLHLRWPLWVAHYRSDLEKRWPPPTVKLPWSIHQYGVGPGLEPRGDQRTTAPGAIDRNFAKLPLATIQLLNLDPLDGMTLDPRDVMGLAVDGNRKGLR